MAKARKITDQDRAFPFRISESLVSMVLGAVVVVLVGLIAYNYFRAQRQNQTPEFPEATTESESANGGRVGTAGAVVALPTSHEVASGENLWQIAEKYYRSGYNYVDIAKVNNLANPGLLEAGQKLTIPKVEVRQPLTVAEVAVQPDVTLSRIEGDKYTVMEGDDLWDIALRAYGDAYRWGEIAKANNLKDPSLIHPGNVLTIPR